jgi:hypothetical protein
MKNDKIVKYIIAMGVKLMHMAPQDSDKSYHLKRFTLYAY